MALAHVGDSAAVADVSGVATIPYSPTPGNALAVYIAQTASASRTYSVGDNIDGATGWVQQIRNAPGQIVEIWTKANVPSGITTISVAASSDTTFRAAASEFSGFGASITLEDADALNEGSASGSHACSASGVSAAKEVLAACAGLLNAAASECDPGSGYTEAPSGETHNQTIFQWRIFPNGVSNEVGAWSSTGTNRSGRSAIVLVSGNGGGGSGISASLNATEDNDSLIATATVAVSASLAATEANDSLSATATVSISASADIAEAADGVNTTATVLVTASLAATEVDDTLTATGTVADPVSGISASVSVTEEADGLSATATVRVGASLSATEADDSLSASATVRVSASLAATESDDSLASTVSVRVAASVSVTEGDDSLTATAAVLGTISATLSVTEADDSVQAFARQMSGLNPTFVLTLNAERRRSIYVEGGRREVILDGAPRSVYV